MPVLFISAGQKTVHFTLSGNEEDDPVVTVFTEREEDEEGWPCLLMKFSSFQFLFVDMTLHHQSTVINP